MKTLLHKKKKKVNFWTKQNSLKLRRPSSLPGCSAQNRSNNWTPWKRNTESMTVTARYTSAAEELPCITYFAERLSVDCVEEGYISRKTKIESQWHLSQAQPLAALRKKQEKVHFQKHSASWNAAQDRKRSGAQQVHDQSLITSALHCSTAVEIPHLKETMIKSGFPIKRNTFPSVPKTEIYKKIFVT